MIRSRQSAALLTALLAFCLSGSATAQQSDDERRTAQRLAQLEAEIERLLADLSPEARDRVRALADTLKAQEASASETVLTEATVPESPVAAGEAPQSAEGTSTPNVAASGPSAAVPDRALPTASEDVPEPVAASPEPPSAAEAAPELRTQQDPTLPATSSPAPSDLEPSTSQACLPLAPFDTSGDGLLSGADRLWRHFYLKTDLPKDDGVVSLFELDIRSVALDVESYGVKGDAEGYVQRGSSYRFQLIGRAVRKVRDGFLAVDATGLARNGTVRLLDASGKELEGIQVLEEGKTFALASGERVSAVCK